MAPSRRVRREGLVAVTLVESVPAANMVRVAARDADERRPELTVLMVSALLFALTATLSIKWCISMAAMGDMSIARRGSWLATGASNARSSVGQSLYWMMKWTVMMVAMMLPALVASLLSFRRAIVGAGQRRVDLLSVVLSAGYFLVWAGVGIGVLTLDAAIAALERWQPVVAGRVVPLAGALAVLIAGVVQRSGWKERQLAHCTRSEREAIAPIVAESWRHGYRLGRCCVASCAPVMSVLLVAGVMNLHGMIAVTTAITIERVAPFGSRLVRPIGVALIGAGLVLMSRA